MPYLEILAPASTVASSISIALGTATVISSSVLTVRLLNDNGTLDTGSSATVALTQQGIGLVIFGSSDSVSLTLSSGVATTAMRGRYGGPVELIAKSAEKLLKLPQTQSLAVPHDRQQSVRQTAGAMLEIA